MRTTHGVRHPLATLLVAVGVSITGAGCGIVPTPPEGVPADWIPDVSPSPLDPDLVDSEFGFTPGEASAVRMRNNGCDDFSTGSGFVLDEHTIVTNKHVVSGYAELEISLSDGTTIDVASAEVATIGDLALVTTAESLDHAVTLGVDPELVDEVVVVGYPDGLQLTTSTGRVIDEVEDSLDNAETIFETTAAGEPGSSGSAVYGADGTVVGVLYAGDDFGNSFIVPVSILRRMIDDATVRQTIDPACVL
jgi:S1-C subfamily serine protease